MSLRCLGSFFAPAKLDFAVAQLPRIQPPPGAAAWGPVGAKTLLMVLVDLAAVEQPNKELLEPG